ncbi:MAG: RNA 2',3'-cyclic phosphodiesterase, partial [Proteobacteria bacterium]|nr:RNA 2',3'-cyclic phosphodiesterase [Pseudomonadota bacterium]
MRAFIAIELPEEVKERLLWIQKSLGKVDKAPGWVKKPGMHLTLKFLGEISEAKAKEIGEALNRDLSSFKPFELRTKSLALNSRHMLWVTFKESKELQKLKDKIETGLESVGVARDKKPYTPHLSLRRIKKKEHLLRVKKALSSIETDQEIRFSVRGTLLIE